MTAGTVNQGKLIMTSTALDKNARKVVPTSEDIKLAIESIKKMDALNIQAAEHTAKLMLTDHHCIEFQLSKTMFEALREVIHEMAAGRAVMLVPVNAELTTQEAANMLNVSRPYFVKLLDEGKIPYRTVGRYRRILYEDLLRYQKVIEAKRQSAMNELTAQAQELNLGY